MERLIILIAVITIIAVGLGAGGVALFQGDSWSPRQYVPADGDCWVPPQGDPLYDEHYSEINKNNCDAFKTQSEAKNIDSQTRAINTKTDMEVFKQRSAITAFVGVIIFLVILALAMMRG